MRRFFRRSIVSTMRHHSCNHGQVHNATRPPVDLVRVTPEAFCSRCLTFFASPVYRSKGKKHFCSAEEISSIPERFSQRSIVHPPTTIGLLQLSLSTLSTISLATKSVCFHPSPPKNHKNFQYFLQESSNFLSSLPTLQLMRITVPLEWESVTRSVTATMIWVRLLYDWKRMRNLRFSV